MGRQSINNRRSVKIVFWGTPQFSIPTLDILTDRGHRIMAVITQPDKKRGRGTELIPSPIKKRALEIGLEVYTPGNIRVDINEQEQISRLEADINIVVAYGQILPECILSNPRYGSWNGHASLLPRWRGAAPIQRCILNGDRNTGVAIMCMEKGLDTGPVIISRAISISLNQNYFQLSTLLSDLTAKLMIQAIDKIEDYYKLHNSNIVDSTFVKSQDTLEGKPSYANMINKLDCRINWDRSSIEIHRRVMALYPNSFCLLNSKRLKILQTEPLIIDRNDELSAIARSIVSIYGNDKRPPGQVIDIIKDIGIIISTISEPLIIYEAQIEGKKPANGRSLLQQLKVSAGTILK